MIGTVLGHYEILALVGKGGMGEVYRAKDTKLGRDVAVKVLPSSFDQDPERLARFQREARTLASLQHPNIASVYGFENIGDKHFLVMELVEGEDLSDHMARGAFSTEKVIRIAEQIATGLEAAHDKGIVHRDLKPANIKLGEDGTVKILDFGLARAFESDPLASDDPMASPTMTAAMTQAGVILGTAAYMSPEQARGKTVDHRADLWSLGVIIFEMLSGRQLFAGETVSDTLAGVLRAEVPWDELPLSLPASLRRVTVRGLERDIRQRLQSAGDARIELAVAAQEKSTLSHAGLLESSGRTSNKILIPAAVLLLVIGFFLSSALAPKQAPKFPVGTSFDLDLCAEGELFNSLGPAALLTPDGKTIVFLEQSGSGRQLMIRRLNEVDAKPLPGTQGATMHFMSPDGEWVGFVAGTKMRKVFLGGGTALDICSIDALTSRGATWGINGKIVYCGATQSGLKIVDAEGGVPEVLTTLDMEKFERSHRWPHFTADGTRVLFNTQFNNQDYQDGNIEAIDLTTKERTLVHRGGAFPRMSGDDHLLYVRDRTIYAVKVDSDLKSLGTPFSVLEDVSAKTGDETADNGAALFHLSQSGDLLVTRGHGQDFQGNLVMIDFSGKRTDLGLPTGHYVHPRVSRDGKSLAFVSVTNGREEILLMDLETLFVSRLKSSEGYIAPSVWSPDGKYLYFAEGGTSLRGISRILVGNRSESEVVSRENFDQIAQDISADGRWLVTSKYSGETSWDLFKYDMIAHPEVPLLLENFEKIVGTESMDAFAAISADQRWLVYNRREAGKLEIYVCEFDNPANKWLVSTGFGSFPVWNDTSDTIYYSSGKTIMSVALNPHEGGLRPDPPKVLVETGLLMRPNVVTYSKVPGQDAFVILLDTKSDDEKIAGEVMLRLDWRASWDK
ncbi:MAG: serine/threonine protein kinase/Tol biopolymer transport system component [Candidatus Krumholzibacteriia bacterium]